MLFSKLCETFKAAMVKVVGKGVGRKKGLRRRPANNFSNQLFNVKSY